MNLLEHHNDAVVRFNCAWAICNLSLGTEEQIRGLVDCGAIPVLVQLLRSSNDTKIKGQALWALSNISAMSTSLRDYVVHMGALDLLVPVLDQRLPELLKQAVCLCDILCKGTPPPATERTLIIVPSLLRVLKHPVLDEEVRIGVAWTLSHMTEGGMANIQQLLAMKVAAVMIPLLGEDVPSLQASALRFVGNIAAGDDLHCSSLIQENTLPLLRSLLASNVNEQMKREAAWTLANISSGPQDHIQAILEADDLLEVLISCSIEAVESIKVEIAWVITNIASAGSPIQVQTAVERGAVEMIAELLDFPSSNLQLILLEGLECIFHAGKLLQDLTSGSPHPYRRELEITGAEEKLEQLLLHPNPHISNAAVQLLDLLGAEGSGSDSEYLVPVTNQFLSGGSDDSQDEEMQF